MKVKLNEQPVMTVYRRILNKDKLVYLLVGPKPIRLPGLHGGRSRIAYVGTTRKGKHRIAASAAYRAEEIFEKRGLRKLDVHVVTCRSTQGLTSWQYLEKAILAVFHERYGRIPVCNQKGDSYRWNQKLEKLFGHQRILNIVMQFDAKEGQLTS